MELRGEQLLAVARLWRQTGRELVTSFEGRSMEPTIAAGQQVRVRCTHEVTVGDVVVVAQAEGVLVHRLIARGNGWWLLRGDRRWICDPPVRTLEELIGRVEAVERGEDFGPVAEHRPGAIQRAIGAAAIAMMRIDVTAATLVLRLLLQARRLLLAAVARARGPHPNS